MLGGGVAGKEPPITAAGSLVVGGLVVVADLAPVTAGMAIEQGTDLVMGHGGGYGGCGHHAAEVVAHCSGCGGKEDAGPEAAPRWWGSVWPAQAVRAWSGP